MPWVVRAAMSSWARRASDSGYTSADHHLELPAGDRPEQLGDPLAKLLRAAEQVHEPEADHGAAGSHQVGVADLDRLPRGEPVGDQAAERGQRPQARLERLAAAHLEHHVDRLAVVRLEDRRLQVVGARVDRGVGAQPRAPARASPPTRRARSPGPAPIRFASCTASEPVPPAAAWTTTDSPSSSRAEIRSRLRAVRPWSSSAAACSSETSSGTGTRTASGTATFSA